MAIIHSHIFDNASGSVGNVTISRYKGKNIAKGKICFKSKKQSAAQVCQQIRFKALSDIAFHFYTAIRAGSPHQSWSTSRVQFIGLNQNTVEVDEETLNVTFHPERITFTTGNLTPPVVNIRIQENNVSFTQNGYVNHSVLLPKMKTTYFWSFMTLKSKTH